ncbi:HAMP domain-containing sensor histidine kinase [Mycoplasmatota bacterium WC30]
MKKLSGKIIFISIITLMISGSIARLAYKIIFGGDFPHAVSEDRIFIGVLITLTLALVVFTAFINHFVVKRIKEVNTATLSILDGNFDVTLSAKGHDEINNLATNFNLMTSELKSNEYLNKEFVRNFSHEFKTPLSVIRGYAELLENDELSKVEKQNYLDIIISESTRLSNLANNMLQVSLIDSTSIITKDDEYNFTEQIRNIIQMIQLMWEEKKLSFNLDLDETYIKSNKELTYQIILNLLSNAIKFSDESGEIKIILKDIDDQIHLTISNKGQTIPTEDFEKVFQLFYIADKTRNEGSTGVGLTLTKKIIDKLKGKISFNHSDGLTSFNVVLPK